MKLWMVTVLCSAVGLFAALSKDVRENFIASCEDGGASEEFCACVFGKVEKKYSQKQIDAIELKMRRGHSDLGYTEFVKKASEECNAKVHAGASLGAVAAEGDDQNSKNAFSAEELSALSALGLDEAFATELAGALFDSPEYRQLFMAECSVEFQPYFGEKMAKKSCECAYQKLASENGLQKIFETMDENGNISDSASLELFLPCLPQAFSPEIEQFLTDSCQKAAPQKVCKCLVQDIKAHFSLQDFIRRVVTDPAFIENYAAKIADRCKEN